MTVYHLNLFNDDDVWDEEGQDFADLDAAEREAVRNARDVIAEHVRHGMPIDLNHRLEIVDGDTNGSFAWLAVDGDGTILKVVRFGDCVYFKH